METITLRVDGWRKEDDSGAELVGVHDDSKWEHLLERCGWKVRRKDLLATFFASCRSRQIAFAGRRFWTVSSDANQKKGTA